MSVSLAALVSQVLVALGGVLALVVLAALVTGIVVAHRLRARWRALRERADVRASLSWVRSLRQGGGRAPSRWRYELWQAVADTTRALEGAERTVGGPIGDLRSLNRRLRATATELDGLLAITAGLPSSTSGVGEVRRQVGDALAASEAIRKAALAAATSSTGGRAEELATDAVREVESVASGVARSRAALSPE